MSSTLVEALRDKQRAKHIVKFVLRRVAQPCVIVLLAYVFPKLAIVYAICGVYDVSRNRGSTWKPYAATFWVMVF